ncbi:MAG: hypothetical protein ABSA68_09560 [Xanthobacteraceae bacterium]|jgi:hypothetical protein
MVSSRARRSKRQQDIGENRAQERSEAIHEFLLRELPPAKTKQARYLTSALLNAGARYDRYNAERSRREWLNYVTRRVRLARITKSANEVASGLCELDILTRDDLASRVDPKEVEVLVGSLRLLSKETADLGKEVQKNGRPRDLAEERWILELADIYENAFFQPASVWRSDAGPASKFLQLLELCRPESFPRHGKLSRRQIDRTLKHRSGERKGSMTLQEWLNTQTEAAKNKG